MSNRKYPRLTDGSVRAEFIIIDSYEAAMFFINKLADSRCEVDPQTQVLRALSFISIQKLTMTLFLFLGIMTGVNIIHTRWVF